MARSLVIPEVRLPERLDFALDTKHHLFTDSSHIRRELEYEETVAPARQSRSRAFRLRRRGCRAYRPPGPVKRFARRVDCLVEVGNLAAASYYVGGVDYDGIANVAARDLVYAAVPWIKGVGGVDKVIALVVEDTVGAGPGEIRSLSLVP